MYFLAANFYILTTVRVFYIKHSSIIWYMYPSMHSVQFDFIQYLRCILYDGHEGNCEISGRMCYILWCLIRWVTYRNILIPYDIFLPRGHEQPSMSRSVRSTLSSSKQPHLRDATQKLPSRILLKSDTRGKPLLCVDDHSDLDERMNRCSSSDTHIFAWISWS